MRTASWLVGAAAAVLIAAAVALARLDAPPPTILLLDRRGAFLGEIGAPGRDDLGYWPLVALPPRVVAATLAVEDRRFGVHPASTRSRWGARRGPEPRQRAARLRAPRPSPCRWRACSLRARAATRARRARRSPPSPHGALRPRGVLAHYLRLAPYGNRFHGIAYAARRYLDKPVDDLSWAETAFLAALPQAPGRMNPYRRAAAGARVARGAAHPRALRDRAALARPSTSSPASRSAAARPRCPAAAREALHAALYLEARAARARAARPRSPTTPVAHHARPRPAGGGRAAAGGHRARIGAAARSKTAVIVLDRDTPEVLAWVGSRVLRPARRRDRFRRARPARRAARSSPSSTPWPSRGLITPPPSSTISARPRRRSPTRTPLPGPAPAATPSRTHATSRPRSSSAGGAGPGWTLLGDLGLDAGRVPALHYGSGSRSSVDAGHARGLVRAYTALAGDGQPRRSRLVAGARRRPPAPGRLGGDRPAMALFLADPMARLPSFPRMGAAEFRSRPPSRPGPRRVVAMRGRSSGRAGISSACGSAIPTFVR